MANLIRRDNREAARGTGAEYGLDPFRVMDACCDGIRSAVASGAG